MNRNTRPPLAAWLVIAGVLIAACSTGTGRGSGDGAGPLRVVATTSIVGDVVQQVGGDQIQLTILMPPGTDPHSFEPRPADAAALSDADLIFANGAGLEESLQPLLENTGTADKLIEVSQGLPLLALEEDGESDPHTWTSPLNVIAWTQTVAEALAAADPPHAALYRANAQTYTAELRDLDAWIRAQVEQVPAGQRKLVSDHAVFGYFAQEYGFEQIGTITGSFSSLAAPSAQELAALEDAIKAFDVPAIFVGETVNDQLAAQVAADTGIHLVTVYHMPGAPDGETGNYIEMMRYNVSAIVNALK